MTRKLSIAIVGAGSLANALAVTLHEAGYKIPEILGRASAASLRRAKTLARRVGARGVTLKNSQLDCDLLWVCVPDREIHKVAEFVANHGKGKVRYAFHSSGALAADELQPLRQQGISVASVHPLMTFVAGGRPSLINVSFAVEGDPAAIGKARTVIRDLGGAACLIAAGRKTAYHAWATMASPLFLAFLVTLEDAARLAGLSRSESRHRSLPIIRQTLDNYASLGPQHSFSGPLIRGDIETVSNHLKILRSEPAVRSAYVALARSALHRLPAGNRKRLLRLLGLSR